MAECTSITSRFCIKNLCNVLYILASKTKYYKLREEENINLLSIATSSLIKFVLRDISKHTLQQTSIEQCSQ